MFGMQIYEVVWLLNNYVVGKLLKDCGLKFDVGSNDDIYLEQICKTIQTRRVNLFEFCCQHQTAKHHELTNIKTRVLDNPIIDMYR